MFADDVDEFGLSTGRKVRKQDLRVGLEITDGMSDWIVTDVLGDGKFKAVPEDSLQISTVHKHQLLRRIRKPSPSQREEDKTTPSAKHGKTEPFDMEGSVRVYNASLEKLVSWPTGCNCRSLAVLR
jgi:hypothetical protein